MQATEGTISQTDQNTIAEPDFLGAAHRAETSLILIERTVERLEAGIGAVNAIQEAGVADGMMQQAAALGWVADGLYDEIVKMTEYVNQFRGHFEVALPEARLLSCDKELMTDLARDMEGWISELFVMRQECPAVKDQIRDLGMAVLGRKEQITSALWRFNNRPNAPVDEVEAGEGGEL